MQNFQFYDYYTNKRISSNSGTNEIHSKLNAELGSVWYYCLLAESSRVMHQDGPSVTWTASLLIKLTNEIKSGFCVSAMRTITRGSKATGSAEEGFEREREREWGLGERCSPVRDCTLFDFAWWMIDYLWKVLWKFTDVLWVQANWDSRLDPKLHLFLIPRVMNLTATDKIKRNSNNMVSLSQPIYPLLFYLHVYTYLYTYFISLFSVVLLNNSTFSF